MVDAILALVLLAYAVSGYRQGALVAFLSLAGFLGGGAAAMLGLPVLMERWLSPETTEWRRVVVLVVGVLVVASIGQAVGVTVGGRLKAHVRPGAGRVVDALLGLVASVLAVAVFVWLLAGALRAGPAEVISRAIGQSRIVATIDRVMPPETARLFSGFRSILDAEGFPRVFEGFGPERIRPVQPPDSRIVMTEGLSDAAESIVKVTGVARACDRGQEGTGWVLARGRVVTNAHVVAGVREPRVQVGGEGRRYDAKVVVFDARRDLAVLDVPDLPVDPLPVGEDLTRGEPAVVAGYPLDGPYRLDSARVREVIEARGADIYGRPGTSREVYSLYGRVQPGNSGGPLLDRDGVVVGVIFAKSLDDDSTGYALTLDEAAPVLEAGRAVRDEVSTGGCAAG